MNNEFLSAVIILTLVTDPFGNVPIVNSMMSGVAVPRRRLVILRECGIAFALLIAFLFAGQSFLALMHLSQTSLSIAGGVILFMSSIRMVFGKAAGAAGGREGVEPFIVPLAIPLIAGPSALATVMLMASKDPSDIRMWRRRHGDDGHLHGDPRGGGKPAPLAGRGRDGGTGRWWRTGPSQ